MKVLALVTDAFGGEGGIARFNRDLLGAVAAAPGVERVEALCLRAPVRDETVPSGVFQVAAGPHRASYALRAMARAFRPGRYGLVLCSHLHLAPLAVAVAALQRVPLWLQLHGIEAWQSPGWLRARAVRRAALVTSVSRCTRARFLEWAAVAPHRVRVLPSTVDERFAPGPKPKSLAERMGLQGRRVLLTVSRINRGDRYKGHDRVLEAVRRLAARMPDLSYVIAGDGDDRSRLEQLARQLGIADRVHFAGRVSDSELPDYYRLADVFVMPSAKEGFGIVFLEAAATGLPVIAGNQDGSADPLADGAIGMLVSPVDEAAIAGAIERALAAPRPDPRRARRFGPDRFRSHAEGLMSRLVCSA